MRLFFADLLMTLGALFGLAAIPWTPFALWALAIGVLLATAGLALDRGNRVRWVAYLGCGVVGLQAPGLIAAALLMCLAVVLRIRGRGLRAPVR
jgi:hypothetical protein